MTLTSSARSTLGTLAAVMVVTLSLGGRGGPAHLPDARQAFTALIAAARAEDTKALIAVLGPEGKSLVVSGDPVADQQTLHRFVVAYEEANRIELQGKDKAALTVGKEEWPFPIPAIKQGNAWHLDAAEERRISSTGASAATSSP